MPRANLRNLMLRPDVVEAVGQKQFAIYAVSTVDEGIEVLTGVSAGQRGPDGRYPEESVNGRVDKKLQEFNERQRQSAPREQRN
jgi:predicted ATP-dependent protease